MDARERLRLYLEQRRELGESELVLDGMPVDEIMSLLGAKPAARAARVARAPVSSMTPPQPASPSTQPPAPPADARDAASAGAPNSPDSNAPPTPTVRFDPQVASADWRETLRQAAASDRAPHVPTGTSRGDAPPVAAPVTSVSSAPAVTGAPVPEASSAPAALPAWLAALDVRPGIAAPSLPLPSASDPRLHSIVGAAHTDALRTLVEACTACALHTTARHPVPGEGSPHAEFVCVGEAPGANEDEQGRPFVGEAGQLLTKILAAIELSRDAVFICNVLKHRPPANRDPLPDEVMACSPFLRQQLHVIQPRVILALGRFAAQTLLGTSLPIGKLRGQVHLYGGTPVIVTYHPAALLRNEAWKRPTWDDVKLARRILDASRLAITDRHAHGADPLDASR